MYSSTSGKGLPDSLHRVQKDYSFLDVGTEGLRFRIGKSTTTTVGPGVRVFRVGEVGGGFVETGREFVGELDRSEQGRILERDSVRESDFTGRTCTQKCVSRGRTVRPQSSLQWRRFFGRNRWVGFYRKVSETT